MAKFLPAHRYHRTPRPLWSDAYTINGFKFESEAATENSVYYGVFRKFPLKHEETVYERGDQRILFAGLQSLCDILFYEPITHAEIDESIAFLKARKSTMEGFKDFEFPEALWRRVVDECEGYLPLKIEGMPEGSVVYPGEPFMRVRATKPGFGPLVPWFESTLLQVWSASERLTAARHVLSMFYNLIREVEPDTVADEQCMFFARLMVQDFSDRAGACPQEAELVSRVHNYVFYGTDTFRAAYQNWKNGAAPAYGSSVKALAHRIVQGYEKEFDCYQKMYDTAENGELLSMVGDCYDYYNALENKLIPLAKQSLADKSGKIIVARPDSGESIHMVLDTLVMAKQAGLMQEFPVNPGPFVGSNTKTMLGSTTLRFIVANGETFDSIFKITLKCLQRGFIPWRCGIFGMGGHLRNNITRDHMSTKFALCAVGPDNRPVIKLSMEAGKQTLPEVKVLRDAVALARGVTLALPSEAGNDAMVEYYDGNDPVPFGIGFNEDFVTCENRVIEVFDKMPKMAGKTTEAVDQKVKELTEMYRDWK